MNEKIQFSIVKSRYNLKAKRTAYSLEYEALPLKLQEEILQYLISDEYARTKKFIKCFGNVYNIDDFHDVPEMSEQHDLYDEFAYISGEFTKYLKVTASSVVAIVEHVDGSWETGHFVLEEEAT